MYCFHILAIAKSASMHICVQVFVEHLSLILWGLHVGVELLGNSIFVVVLLCLTFWGITKLYSAAAAQFCPNLLFSFG